MTKAEMRVAVAKDVIKQLKIGKITAEHCYLDDMGEFNRNIGKSMQTVIKNPAFKCNACAIGSALISFVNLFNGITIIEEISDDLDRNGIHKILSKCFTKNQLEDMEGFFEWGSDDEFNGRHHVNSTWYTSTSSEDKLIQIMQCIINNKGNFKPTKEMSAPELE